jgi:hypothetical protein
MFQPVPRRYLSCVDHATLPIWLNFTHVLFYASSRQSQHSFRVYL